MGVNLPLTLMGDYFAVENRPLIHQISQYVQLSRRNQGCLHKRGDGARCTMAKIGGDLLMIMMLLLVFIIIYYYMNTFITLHSCTFNLLFALIYITLRIVVAQWHWTAKWPLFCEFSSLWGALRKHSWQSHNYEQFTITVSSSKRLQRDCVKPTV